MCTDNLSRYTWTENVFCHTPLSYLPCLGEFCGVTMAARCIHTETHCRHGDVFFRQAYTEQFWLCTGSWGFTAVQQTRLHLKFFHFLYISNLCSSPSSEELLSTQPLTSTNTHTHTSPLMKWDRKDWMYKPYAWGNMLCYHGNSNKWLHRRWSYKRTGREEENAPRPSMCVCMCVCITEMPGIIINSFRRWWYLHSRLKRN